MYLVHDIFIGWEHLDWRVGGIYLYLLGWGIFYFSIYWSRQLRVFFTEYYCSVSCWPYWQNINFLSFTNGEGIPVVQFLWRWKMSFGFIVNVMVAEDLRKSRHHQSWYKNRYPGTFWNHHQTFWSHQLPWIIFLMYDWLWVNTVDVNGMLVIHYGFSNHSVDQTLTIPLRECSYYRLKAN